MVINGGAVSSQIKAFCLDDGREQHRAHVALQSPPIAGVRSGSTSTFRSAGSAVTSVLRHTQERQDVQVTSMCWSASGTVRLQPAIAEVLEFVLRRRHTIVLSTTQLGGGSRRGARAWDKARR